MTAHGRGGPSTSGGDALDPPDAVDAHARLMRLFDALCDAPPVEQRRRLDALRRRDAALVERLAGMLDADRDAGSHLDAVGGAVRLMVDFAGTVVGGRWRLVDRVGRGGGGEVWRAEAIAGGPDVAIKLIDVALMGNPRQIRRFRREFRTLARIDHEGCVRVIAEGAIDDDTPLAAAARRFIVMEFLGGGDLTRLARAPTATLLPALLQLANALDHIHSHQIVHRDLKPANVLLTRDEPPRVKLADFGVVRLTVPDGSQLTDAGSLIGTPDFLSPEQVRGARADPRSDLYALGCLMHTLWAGDAPFSGNRMERLWARVDRDAPPLASRAPDAPPEICALADALTRADPARRPATAKEVAQRIYALMPSLGPRRSTGVDAAAPTTGRGAYLFSPGLVGRDEMMATLLEVATRARETHRLRSVALIGAAGVGKSTVGAALLRRLSDGGWRCVRVGTGGAAKHAPFAPFPALEAALAASNGAVVLGAEPLPAAVRPDQQAHLAQRRMARSIAARLAASPRDRPTCVLIEDLHDASADAIRVLGHLCGDDEARRLPTLVVLTGRPHARARLAAIPEVRVVALPALDRCASTRVVARVLGARTEEIPAALARPLLDEAGGNPLLLRTAVRNLAESGALRRSGGVWTVRAAAAGREAVTSLLEGRLMALEPATEPVVAAAAVLGERFDPDLLAAVADVDEDALLDALSDGIRAAVFASDTAPGDGAETFRFDHARLAELTLSRLEADRRAALHDAAGEASLARGAAAGVLAFHFGRGTDPRRALTHLEAAADEARDAHDHAMVVDCLQQMLRRLGDGGRDDGAEAALTERLADALVASERHAEAAVLFQRLEGHAAGDLARGRLLRKRGMALLRADEPGRGVAALDGALTLLGDRTPRTRTGRVARMSWDALAAVVGYVVPSRRLRGARLERAQAHRELALMYRWIDLYDSAAHLARFYRLAGRRSPAAFQVDANAMAAMLFALRSMPGAGSFVQKRARELAHATGDLVGLARLTVIQGGCEAMLDDSLVALARMDAGVELARQTGDRWLLCFALTMRAWVRGLVGSVPRAHVAFTEAADLARDIGAVWLEADATSGAMLSGLVIGRIDEGERAARKLLTSDVRLAFPIFEQLAVEGMAGVAFLTGRFDAALSGYERAQELLRRHRLDQGWGWLVPMEIVEAACCLADEVGSPAVPRLLRRMRRGTRAMRRMRRLPLYRGCATVGRGVIASRRGRHRAAHARFAEAVAERGDGRRSYIDTWVMVRPALERLHMGAPRDAVAVELDAVDDEYARLGLSGLRGWLAIMRGVHDV